MGKNLDGVKVNTSRRSKIQEKEIKRPVPSEYRSLVKPKRNRAGCLWFLFLLFIAAVGGFYYWNQRPAIKINDSLELIVTGPSEIISGDQAVYKIKYKNLDLVPLKKMELSVKWPAGFYFDESTIEPSDINATTWDLKDLNPGQEMEFEIKGQLVGNKDEELLANFIMYYQPDNFSSDFNLGQELSTKIKDSKLSLSLEGPDKTLINTEQEFQVKYKNLTNEIITGLSLDILYPADLEIKEVSQNKEGDYWPVELQPNEEKVVTIKGSFSSDAKPEQKFVAELGSKVNDKFRRLSRSEKNIAIINPQFTVNLKINNRPDNQTVNWGDTLRYELEVVNNSDTDINDVVISALLDGLVLDWSSLDTIAQHDGSKLVWDKQVDKELSTWSKGQTKNFTWLVKVVANPQADRMLDNIIKINIEGLPAWEQVGEPVTLTVGESITFNNGIYWDLAGRRVGSGLVPPQVGVETRYLVVWSLSEQTGDFDTVKVESTLPPNVSFVEVTDVQEGELSFDSDTRNLVWDLPKFDKVILPTAVSFLIEIKPSAEDQGQAMSLLNSTIVTASGLEEVKIRSKLLKTSDVVSNSSEPIGIVR